MASPERTEAAVSSTDDLLASRYDAYGDPLAFARRLGGMWGACLGVEIAPRQVELMLACLKIAREWHAHRDDNVDDAIAYLTLGGRLADEH